MLCGLGGCRTFPEERAWWLPDLDLVDAGPFWIPNCLRMAYRSQCHGCTTLPDKALLQSVLCLSKGVAGCSSPACQKTQNHCGWQASGSRGDGRSRRRKPSMREKKRVTPGVKSPGGGTPVKMGQPATSDSAREETSRNSMPQRRYLTSGHGSQDSDKFPNRTGILVTTFLLCWKYFKYLS